MLIFSNEKAFRDVLGSTIANYCGLHIFRMLLSDLSCFLRRIPFSWLAPNYYQELSRNGIVVIENFADKSCFQAISQEIQEALDSRLITPDDATIGFGEKIHYEQGFDRYDGSSLNRLVEINNYPSLLALVTSKKMNKLTLALFGMLNHKSKYYAYQLIHGDHTKNPDNQKYLHKDTFHSTYKLWYFVDDVTLDMGPFEYSYKSHKSTWQRLKWEYQMSCAVSVDKSHTNRGGAFKISAEELSKIQAKPPTKLIVKANSMVIADTKGFHRRGDAPIGSSRISLYANFRPLAFLPFVH